MFGERDLQELRRLIRARGSSVSIVTLEEDYAIALVRHVAFELNLDVHLWSIVGGVRDGLVADKPPEPETEHPAAALFHYAYRLTDASVIVTLDLAGHLNDERTRRLLRELVGRVRARGATLIMIDHSPELPSVIRSQTISFNVSLPDEKELDNLVRTTLKQLHKQNRFEVKLSTQHFRSLLRNLRGLSRRQAEQIIVECVEDDRQLDLNDMNTVLARKRQMIQSGGLLEFVQTPVSLDEIGGLRHLKRWLKQRREAGIDEARAFGIPVPRGVLMLGVQGAGKSLSAKAIATAWQWPLLRLDPGVLYDRYVGESERRLREALHQAEVMAPIVLWVDEIEKAFASAASHSIDGGLSQRMFGTLLTWMQEHRAAVFLAATANDIEALPPELLRKGRFDEIFFIDLPDRAARKQIIAIHLKNRKRDPAKFDVDSLVAASDGYSGAEIEQAIISALHDAFADGATLETDRIERALRSSPPISVTLAERIQGLRRWANGRCCPAD